MGQYQIDSSNMKTTIICLLSLTVLYASADLSMTTEGMAQEFIAGGLSPNDPTSDEAQSQAHFAHGHFLRQRNAKGCDYKLEKVLSHSTQVVAGVNHYIEYKINDQRCRAKVCNAIIWEQSWTGKHEVTSMKCA